MCLCLSCACQKYATKPVIYAIPITSQTFFIDESESGVWRIEIYPSYTTFLSALGALLPVVARVPLVVRDLLLAEVANLLGRRLVPALTCPYFVHLSYLYRYIRN